MRSWFLVAVSCVAVGCSGGKSDPADKVTDMVKKAPPNDSMAGSNSPKDFAKFSDDVFKIPIYPGSSPVAYTAIEMNMDTEHMYARHFSTTDDLAAIEAFVKTEGAKVGKYSNNMNGVFNIKLIRQSIVDFKDGSRLTVKMTRDEKGGKSDIMYNMTEPKKK